MKVCVVGWYGTETIGDRAILAGIFDFLSEVYGDFEVKLGSLFPFFSRRTFSEDAEFYRSFLKSELKGQIFESKKRSQLDDAIKASDLVVIGGGPLMHINDLFMLEYAMKRAKKLGKATLVFGCGVGPLFKKRHKPALWGIMKYADQIILRDQRSFNYMQNLSASKTKALETKLKVAVDPSIKALLRFKKSGFFKEKENPYVAINLREFPSEYAKDDIGKKVNSALSNWLNGLSEQLAGKEIRLIPMHYFHIGNDDRAFMNSLRFAQGIESVKIQNEPLNLFETMLAFKEADICFGMRFHSVIFQTILNGNNYVLDYTEPGIGKISGFIDSIDKKGLYNERCINLQNLGAEGISQHEMKDQAFQVNEEELKKSLSIFEESLQKI